ncbi:Glutamate receptor [Thalictrum thalictroides]|uniref:Glutamate receptor n=1 Tax=Thalictrum thalictroides TaxID=46969 RepID=A0A7J6XEM9_THATH|nr:Glutamate receptor [Thalictrum thalictroides]
MFTPSATSLRKLFFLFTSLFIISLFHGNRILAQNGTTNIGAIIDINSRIGKEEKISMEIAVQIYNNTLNKKHKIVLHVSDSGGNPFQAASAGNNSLSIKQNKYYMINL